MISEHVSRSSNPGGRPLGALLLAAAVWLAGGAARAQELYTFTVGAMGGVGGSPDDAQAGGYDHKSLQLNFQFATDPRTQVGLRYGQLDLTGAGERIGAFFEPQLKYLSIGGEYRTQLSYYDSGLFAALGAYRLEGGGAKTQTAIGLSVGATGEFQINRHFGVIAEIAGHYADLDQLQLFATVHAGLAVHF